MIDGNNDVRDEEGRGRGRRPFYEVEYFEQQGGGECLTPTGTRTDRIGGSSYTPVLK
jgi:hypothetical protein